MSKKQAEKTPLEIAQERVENSIVVARETMVGNLVQLVRDECEALPTIWPGMSDAAKTNAYDRWQRRIETAVREAVTILSTEARPHVLATVEQVTFKDGVKAVLQLSKSSGAHELAEATQSTVLIVIPEDVKDAYGGGVPGQQIGLGI